MRALTIVDLGPHEWISPGNRRFTTVDTPDCHFRQHGLSVVGAEKYLIPEPGIRYWLREVTVMSSAFIGAITATRMAPYAISGLAELVR